MAIIDKTGASVALAAVLLMAGAAHALSPADKCEASKLSTAGKYDFCRLKVEAKAVKTASTPDYSKCTANFDQKWNLAETNGGGMCPDTVLTAPMNAYIAGQAADAAAIIAGTQGIPACGDNAINVAGEQCDGTDLGGETCLTLGFASGSLTCASCLFDTSGCTCGGGGGGGLPETGQTQCDQGAGTLGACPGSPAGQDGAVLAGATRSYTDNGDGTITDNVTGLMWEKLSNDSSIHDYLNFYAWYPAFTTKIATLNSGSFAGHSDWRLPNSFELYGLADLGRVNPAIDPAFNTSCTPSCTVTTCSCTAPYFYWSATSDSSGLAAWYVNFGSGGVVFDYKTGLYCVRAVRGGS